MDQKPPNIDQGKLKRAAALLGRIHALKNEALMLYRARPNTVEFHSSKSTVTILRGGNRSGKTTAAAAETASVATGLPILGPDGKPISPARPKGPLRIWVIGYDLKHVGQTIHRVLFKPGLFRIIKDEVSGDWRTWRPWEEADAQRESETKESPPLIPERYIEEWSWEDKGQNVFNSCKLTNGNTIYAFGSRSEAKQGDTVHWLWIDEDIEYPQHVPEWVMRLPDVKGRLIWSVFPHEQNDALVKLSDKAFMDRGKDDPTAREIQLTFSGNEFIGEKEKRTSLDLLDPDERLRRDLGEFNRLGRMVFPTYSDSVHGMDMAEFAGLRGAMSTEKWCRYLVIDPGWARCAVAFWAVSPPAVWPEINLLEDELYLEHVNAGELAEKIAGKMAGRCYQAFIVDKHGSRITEIASGQTIVSRYEHEFRKRNIRSVETYSGFEQGCDNRDMRILAFREMLAIGEEGAPRFRFIRENTSSFQMEIMRYKRKLDSKTGNILDEPDDRFYSHLMVCCQYFAAAMYRDGRVRYHPPRARGDAILTPTQEYLKRKLVERQRKRPAYVNLGPEQAHKTYEFV